jgi:hypothetical protein
MFISPCGAGAARADAVVVNGIAAGFAEPSLIIGADPLMTHDTRRANQLGHGPTSSRDSPVREANREQEAGLQGDTPAP